MSRYHRQEILPGFGAEGQARLAGARVLVAGAGGLAASLLPLLVGAGLGRIIVVDPDRVETHNLHRQTLFRAPDIGQPKALAAARALEGLNPDCQITPLVARLDPALARDLLARGCDLMIDAADSIALSFALSDLGRAAGVGLIGAAVQGRAGYVGGFCAGAPSYRALFSDLPAQMPGCGEAGVSGPAVACLGALQAEMALAALLGLGPSPFGQIMRLDLENWQMRSFRFDNAPEVAGPQVLGLADLAPGDRLIDLRGPGEGPALPPLPGLAAPLHRAVQDCASLPPWPGGRTVFLCRSGLRAWRAAQAWTQAKGTQALGTQALGTQAKGPIGYLVALG